jgi:predicted MFS family arabinose efflux permease
MQLRALVRWQAIPRQPGVSARLVRLMLAARFLDEWWVGLLLVLMPLIRDDLGLSYAEVSVLLASFGWAEWVADPITGLVGDVWPRRPLIAWSAIATAVIFVMLSGANSFLVMLLVCFGYSITVTPLATVADAVLVDTHPDAPGRIMARQTLIDTVGALLAPLTATVLATFGVPWPIAFVAGGCIFVGYALLLFGTRFPPTNGANHEEAEPGDGKRDPLGLRMMWRNLKLVGRQPRVWRWLFFIAFSDFLGDVAVSFLPLFLADVIGLSDAMIGVYMAAYMAAGVVSLALLEPALARWGEGRVLWAGVLGVGVLFPLWVFSQHPVVTLAFLMLYALFASVLWPLGKARLLAAADGLTATVRALGPIAGLPTNVVPLVVGAVASAAGLRAGMLVLMIAPPLMLLLMRDRAARPARTPAQ